MNYSLYLFGKNSSGYVQYPSDGEESFLRPLCDDVQDTQLTVYRKDALFHYAFIRQLSSDSSQVFGLCIVTNGVLFSDIKAIYHSFDNIFSRIVFNGKILKIGNNGKISFVYENFAADKNIIEQTQSIVDDIVKDDMELSAVRVKENYSGLISTKNISLEERNTVILNAIDENNVVHIYTKERSDSPINYVEQTISRLYEENNQLKNNYSKLQSQKKQLQIVLVLAVILVFAGMGIYFLRNSLNETRDNLTATAQELDITRSYLSSARDTIGIQNGRLAANENEISSLKRSMQELEDNLQTEEDRRILIENEFQNFRYFIENREPFFVKSTSFNFGNGYLSFDYYGFVNKYVDISVRAFGNDGKAYSNTASIYISSGNHSARIYLSRNLNSSNWYSFEILKNNVIIGGDRH